MLMADSRQLTTIFGDLAETVDKNGEHDHVGGHYVAAIGSCYHLVICNTVQITGTISRALANGLANGLLFYRSYENMA